MAATAGRTLRVKVSPTAGGAGVYTAVAGVESATFDQDGANVDVTTLTDADIARIQVMKDAKFTLSGNYEVDTNGQGAIRAALSADSTLWFQFLPDGTTGFKKEVKVGKYSIGGSTKTQLTFSADLEGTGATGTV